ncbi:MAG: translation initiation factor IF-2 [Pseudomonadota bacterium]
MSEEKKETEKKTLSAKPKGTLSLGGSSAAKAKQALGGGTVVEVRRTRQARNTPLETPTTRTEQKSKEEQLRSLTSDEREARAEALKKAIEDDKRKAEEAKNAPATDKKAAAPTKKETKLDARERELAELQAIEAEEQARAAEVDAQARERTFSTPDAPRRDDTESVRDKLKRNARAPKNNNRRSGGKITVTQVLNEEYDRDRSMSLAAQRRAQQKKRLAMQAPKKEAAKVFREVTVPEAITVQELANRMTEPATEVIKALMKMGVMATINQSIDADTAELIVDEFGHKVKRVTDADVEQAIEVSEDNETDLVDRPPVVTIMGHVDHGKTSLLDALRQTDVVAGEAGGITQHIGAYQIEVETGQKVTFLDTPGHAAFTEMRARGANVTDIVVIVVSAADSIMPQTIEAINHAKAAEVPIIVAINKVDLPEANAMKVKQDLLQHEVVIEEMGGDVQAIEVSAKAKTNLDKLVEAITLQAELLELKANPTRSAQGAVVESKMEAGRGSVATILIQNGTLKQGDNFVVGSEFGKVRALINDKGEQIKEAPAGLPVEVLGLNGTPEAGDILNVTEESKAKEIAEYRANKKRELQATAVTSNRSFESMMDAQKESEKKTLAVVIKGDVHGSVEAIIGSLNKLTEDSDEVAVQVLHSGVGGITESDITLANASNAMVIGFNVRANAQARDLAQQNSLPIRYYNIIYDVIDDAKGLLSGMLSPEEREEYLGQAEIREVFNISKFGNIAGCMVTTGMVKRGAKVRLLRDDVVIHEGTLKTLKRFKDEVKEVKESTECGMAFENYDDIKVGDVIECYEIVAEARSLD